MGTTLMRRTDSTAQFKPGMRGGAALVRVQDAGFEVKERGPKTH